MIGLLNRPYWDSNRILIEQFLLCQVGDFEIVIHVDARGRYAGMSGRNLCEYIRSATGKGSINALVPSRLPPRECLIAVTSLSGSTAYYFRLTGRGESTSQYCHQLRIYLMSIEYWILLLLILILLILSNNILHLC